MDMPHFVYPIVYGWTFELFSLWAVMSNAANEHSCASFCVNVCFHFSWVNILGFVCSSTVSVATTQLCFYSTKQQ